MKTSVVELLFYTISLLGALSTEGENGDHDAYEPNQYGL